MSDLIDRQVAVDALIAQANHEGAYGYIDAKEAEDVLMLLPSVDVPDRKVGEWIEPTREGCITFDKYAYAECTACGGKAYLGWWMHYCPNCGAKMEANDGNVH